MCCRCMPSIRISWTSENVGDPGDEKVTMNEDESRSDQERIVEEGYDRMAEGYLGSKDARDPEVVAALGELVGVVPGREAALDLGCGAGVPATVLLAEMGFRVTGVDVSARQLELARERVPSGVFIKADMTSVEFPEGAFDAVVAFYSIIHVPREKHNELLGKIYGWLKPGGAFLATWPMTEWEGSEENWEGWGATMWWSHFSGETYLGMLREAGFSIASAEV